MIVPDINLLVYAYDITSRFHKPAASWWEQCLNGQELVGLPLVVAFGFVRIVTSSRVMHKPMSAQEAVGHVNSWLGQPVVQVLSPGASHLHEVLKSLTDLGTAGNLVSDAQIAALAIEYDAVLHTADADFLRFAGLKWFNPLTGARPAKSRRT